MTLQHWRERRGGGGGWRERGVERVRERGERGGGEEILGEKGEREAVGGERERKG